MIQVRFVRHLLVAALLAGTLLGTSTALASSATAVLVHEGPFADRMEIGAKLAILERGASLVDDTALASAMGSEHASARKRVGDRLSKRLHAQIRAGVFSIVSGRVRKGSAFVQVSFFAGKGFLREYVSVVRGDAASSVAAAVRTLLRRAYGRLDKQAVTAEAARLQFAQLRQSYGRLLLADGDVASALTQFQAGARLAPLRSLEFDLARARLARDDKAAALVHFERYLAATGDADKSELRRARAGVKRLRRQERKADAAAQRKISADERRQDRLRRAEDRKAAKKRKRIARTEKLRADAERKRVAKAEAAERAAAAREARRIEKDRKRAAAAKLREKRNARIAAERAAKKAARAEAAANKAKQAQARRDAREEKKRAAAELAAKKRAAVGHLRAAKKHVRAGDHDAALRAYEQAYAADPNPAYLFEQAETLRRAKQRALAIARYEKFLAAAPKHARARLATKYLSAYRDQLRADPEALAAAKQKANQAVSEGNALLAEGKAGQAISAYSRARAASKMPIQLFKLGRAHHLAGHRDQALAFYKQFVALKLDVPESATAAEHQAALQAEAVPAEDGASDKDPASSSEQGSEESSPGRGRPESSSGRDRPESSPGHE